MATTDVDDVLNFFNSDNYKTINNEINELRKKAHIKGYELLKLLNKNNLNLVTTESLTAGLIFSTLVDIPRLGGHKYGCFGVYDTDAKKKFNEVTTEHVYSHKCVKQMCSGALKKSNACISLAVSGNAMPIPIDKEYVGEVFFGICAYKKSNNKIIAKTYLENFCNDKCDNWFNTTKPGDKPEYASIDETYKINQFIRYSTVIKSYELLIDFINSKNAEIKQISDIKNIDCDDIKCNNEIERKKYKPTSSNSNKTTGGKNTKKYKRYFKTTRKHFNR